MSRISKADRQLQLQREAAGDHLYANRVRVYPKSVHGPVRRFKWAVLIVCLGIYYLLPLAALAPRRQPAGPGGAAVDSGTSASISSISSSGRRTSIT